MSNYSKVAEDFFLEAVSIHLNEYRKIESKIQNICNDNKLNFVNLLSQDMINKFKDSKISYLPLFVIKNINTYKKPGKETIGRTTYYSKSVDVVMEEIDENIMDNYRAHCCDIIADTKIHKQLLEKHKEDKNYNESNDLYNVCGFGSITDPSTDKGVIYILNHFINREQDNHDFDNIIEPLKKKYFKEI